MLTAQLGTEAGRPLTILCLGAHSDDVEIGCGGTLLRLLAEHPGSTVHWVTFSATSERADETRSSAAAFTAEAARLELDIFDFAENHFPSQLRELKEQMGSVARTVTPDVVFTHRREDLHQDHSTIAELTWQAFRDHVVLEYEIPKFEGDLGHPNLFVPLSADQARRKVDLICEHFATQADKPWFRPEVFTGLMAVRGVECVAPGGYAEGFTARKLVL